MFLPFPIVDAGSPVQESVAGELYHASLAGPSARGMWSAVRPFLTMTGFPV
jgi:hypothetical protein